MRIAMVSSRDLLTKPWGAEYHLPGKVTDEAKRLVLAWNAAQAVHGRNPDKGSAVLLEIISELASKQAKVRKENPSLRADRLADRELFERTGIPLTK